MPVLEHIAIPLEECAEYRAADLSAPSQRGWQHCDTCREQGGEVIAAVCVDEPSTSTATGGKPEYGYAKRHLCAPCYRCEYGTE